MAVLIEMPVTIYQTFLGRCPSLSREYDLLKNFIVSRAPLSVRLDNVVECLCELDDAKLLLTRAKVSYPLASSYIEKGIRLAQKPFDASQIEYRKTAVQLRDHPQMNFAGYANWPPIWVSGAGSETYKKTLGEVGILIDVILNEAAPDKLFLRMEIKSEQRYCRVPADSEHWISESEMAMDRRRNPPGGADGQTESVERREALPDCERGAKPKGADGANWQTAPSLRRVDLSVAG